MNSPSVWFCTCQCHQNIVYSQFSVCTLYSACVMQAAQVPHSKALASWNPTRCTVSVAQIFYSLAKSHSKNSMRRRCGLSWLSSAVFSSDPGVNTCNRVGSLIVSQLWTQSFGKSE